VRTRDPEGKREAMLTSGLAVADEDGLVRLSINRVVAAAGVAKGSFFHHFGDRSTFLVELHRRFHDRLAASVAAAVTGMAPGRARLVAGTTAYLNGCRRDAGTRALLGEARAEPAVLAEVERRTNEFAAAAQPDFAAMGRRHPAAAARLWVVMAADVALAESAAGRRLPRRRAALADFAGSGTTG
jgi:TetR/AcrR family transcriptional regulator, transcriptional repressor for nem operon